MTAQIDWSRACFPVGVKVKGQHKPWLELEAEEVKMLRLLLSKRIPLADGTHAPAAKEVSENLSALAQWCEAAEAWLEGRKPALFEELPIHK